MKLPIFVVDAFTDQLFKGNSAAVVVLSDPIDKELMQSIATENNLSETAFLFKQDDGKYQIRWFSPITEIDFCGHATLAASFVLFQHYKYVGDIIFTAKAVGELVVSRQKNGLIEMIFPQQIPDKVETIPKQILEGLTCSPIEVLKNRQAYFVILDKVQDVVETKYDSEILKTLAPFDVVVTAKSDKIKPQFNLGQALPYDFVSRYFWPANGGDEDPVTGSIHTGLAPYWANKLDKTKLIAYQASRRGGILYCTVNERTVTVAGHAIGFSNGQLDL